MPLGAGFAAFRAAFAETAGRETALDGATFAETVVPETFIARRARPGGPAPAVLDAAFGSYTEGLAGLRARTEARAWSHVGAEQSLQQAFSKLTEA